MRKYFVFVAGLVLMFAPRMRADTTVSDGSPDTFEAAVEDTVAAGGGTILVTTPIVIGDADDTTDDTFDGESNIVVSGGSTNSIFIVPSGSLTLANFTLEDGLSTNGGAIYVGGDGTLTVTNCVFLNNVVQGVDGVSADTNAFDNSPATGKNGGKGTSATPGLGGAIFNAGAVSVLNCQFFTNSALGGNGGDGGDGQDGGVRGGNGGSGGSGGMASGGGVYNSGELLLVNSTFEGNLSQGGNGGIGGAGGGGGIISGVGANGGAAGGATGAGLYTTNMDSTVVILNCTFSGNTSQGGNSADGGTTSGGNGFPGSRGGDAFGGGIENAGSLAITNSTFFENSADGGTGGNGGVGAKGGTGGSGGNAIGGGLYNLGKVSVVNCTFSEGNAAGGTNGVAGSGVAAGRDGKRGSSLGGNIANVAKKKQGSFFLMNSIVATNLSGGGGYGAIIDGGFNISADKSIKFKKKSTSKMKLDPLVGDLADNGGPTETIALATNSPAVDKLDPATAPDTDQRGVSRPQIVFADLSDIGAYELDKNTAKILTQPQSMTAIAGSNVTFSVTAGGTGPLFYQWLFNEVPLTNFTDSSLLITNAQPTNAGNYQVVVSNAFNSVTSHVATLTVTFITNSAPVITQPPVSQSVAVGTTVTFSVTATGTAPLMYQWVYQDPSFVFTNIFGATNATFSITNVQTTDQGNYGVAVTNNFGVTNGGIAVLIVTNSDGGIPTPPSPDSLRGGATAGSQSSLAPLATVRNSGPPATMNFTFATQLGATYVIEYKKFLTDPVWTPITTNIGNGDWLTNEMVTTNQPSGFYRVRSP